MPDGLDAAIRARCNRAGILFALDDLWAAHQHWPTLREMLAFVLRAPKLQSVKQHRASSSCA